MNVTYCDLCGSPIKDIKYRVTIFEYREIVPESNNYDEKPVYYKKVWNAEKEREICETCKGMMEKIFEKRLIGILKLAEDIKTIYNLEPKNEKIKNKKADIET